MKNTLILKFLLLFISCKFISCKKPVVKTHAHTNNLITETSPYLLQHAHNPVNWNAWNNKTLAKAKSSKKLMLISIGYASCHWCHVMEEESFKDTLVAKTMNKNFINIKVDREERPDVDKVYMTAVQLMNGGGGWPLNVVALPDGRPIWGGTYFEKEQWIDILNKLSDVYEKNPEKLIAFADQLEKGIKSVDVVELNLKKPDFTNNFIQKAIDKWSANFDHSFGGLNSAPKFMMPNNYHFLLRYATQKQDAKLQDYVYLTLEKMAFGGIFDPIEGGFSRYSVDKKWHIPHFEKMLYDNAQLVSLYSDAYSITKNPLYKEVVLETLNYVNANMIGDKGSFYSSLDADSETKNKDLEEGIYYVWTKKELQSLLNDDYLLFEDYYNINDYGFWENEHYVLIRNAKDVDFIKKHNITIEFLKAKKKNWKQILKKAKQSRKKPRLDDKVLTSWNALMLKGYIDAYRVFGDENYLRIAKENAKFIVAHQLKKDGSLLHTYKDGKSSINGYLEDYAFTIEALIGLYENTLEEKWLTISRDLADYTFAHFLDENSKMFYFTSNKDASLVARSIAFRDNVLPSSNSVMAKNLFKLSHYFDNKSYLETAKAMLNNVQPELESYPSGFSNWLDLMMNFSNPYYEIAVVGEKAKDKIKELNKNYIPNKLIAGSLGESNMPLLENRYNSSKTLIYVCVNRACKLPVSKVEKALGFIERNF
ncbi:thioredoxin domain-containing protein [Polaribacter batillariae]|uniref:Thioredoxin domain-containing protein n=1 Tax=Polaribacter batillariae TaxID=2808900 RepID=A0ABX7STD0_9FLAO|nr:thioredoxin domain-containing protein [Polaribacter batillariae]QTD36919.1 thioredoxin domain-containing protein [Polaribacter batillariae]